MMKELKIFKDIEQLIKALADNICDISKEAIAERGQFNFVLSGGSSPRKLYELLASEAYKNKINWEKTWFFFGDERYVPENDAERNSLMAKQALFDPLTINASHVFKVDTSVSPEDAAKTYVEAIAKHFQNKTIEFDFILLGLGDNAHTASLFPYTSVLEEKEATIKYIFVKELDKYRITMTAPLINQARHITFLVFGENKAEAVYHVLKDKSGSFMQYPARLINSEDKQVQWFLDSAAAASL